MANKRDSFLQVPVSNKIRKAVQDVAAAHRMTEKEFLRRILILGFYTFEEALKLRADAAKEKDKPQVH